MRSILYTHQLSFNSLVVLLEMLIVSMLLGILHAIRFAGKCNDCQFLWSRRKSAVLCVFIMSNTTEHS